ncbi:MAG: VWA domain-containing protein [Deltaproteobacteria bacterium]|nr:VWA domain-containing protein [Deltaproteobacteria bacterium]
MASFSRRTTSSFSLSFLDIMFCGFGAVVLLVLLINSNTITLRQNRVSELRSEMLQEEMERRLTHQHLEQQRLEITTIQHSTRLVQNSYDAILDEIRRVRQATITASEKEEIQQKIVSLQEELKALEKKSQELTKKTEIEQQAGKQVRSFIGKGNRQYLTGLKLDGKRVLILVDSSASMLDRKIVDIIRRKVLDEPSRRAAPKWQKALSTVEWLVANLPPTSSIQLFHFNTSMTPLAEEKSSWIPVTEFSRINTILAELKKVAPLGGTNLEEVFLKARTIIPPPDNIVLLTDGLPTQGRRGKRSKTIDGAGRLKLYEQAIKSLPAKTPVNTILFPMEGDPLAPSLFWKLAIDSGGSFFTPTRDWP